MHIPILAKLTVVPSLLVAIASAQGPLPVWGSVASPNEGNRDNLLHSIAPVADNDIWAVGEWNPGVVPTVTGRRTLVEHWDGTAWSVVPTPQLDTAGYDAVILEDAVALAANNVWAVGHADNFASLESATLIAHWDGVTWSIIPSPNPSGIGSPDQPFSVSALGPNRIYAVGTTGYPARSLILQWNGRAWAVVANQCHGTLLGVSASSSANIVAVSLSAACRFDGTSWANFTIPPLEFPYSYGLKNVASISPMDVWLAGSQVQEVDGGDGTYFVYRSLTLHWDGSVWTPFEDLGGSAVNALLALSPNDVWAVGSVNPGGLIGHWNGKGWKTVISPNPQGTATYMDVKASPTTLWATGSFFGANGSQTLIARAPSPDKGAVYGPTGVSGALVSWIGPVSGSSTTDTSGVYVAADLPAGTYTFIASNGGCTPAVAIVTVAGGTAVRKGLPISCN